MVVPTRAEAAAVLLGFRRPSWFLAHVSAVAEVAAFLARRIEERGLVIDRPLVEAAALLHDIDKLFPSDDPLRSLGHGDAGARWLTEHGMPELARAVAGHPITRLSDPRRYERWAAFSDREVRVVAYADKRAAQRLMPLDGRIKDMARRHPEHRDALAFARPRAQRLEREICAAAGIRPEEVRRQRWVSRALLEAAKR